MPVKLANDVATVKSPLPKIDPPFTVFILVPLTNDSCASVIPYPAKVVGVLVISLKAILAFTNNAPFFYTNRKN